MYASATRWINMSGLNRVPVSSAAPVPGRAPTRAGSRASRIVVKDFAAHARIPRSSQAGHRNRRKKMFRSDYPRGIVNCLWLCWFPALRPLSVALALIVPFLLTRRRLPVSLLRLPARPLPRRIPASLAAVALACLPGMKALIASFQQTQPHPRSACQWLRPTLLIFGMTCRTLGRAHGR